MPHFAMHQCPVQLPRENGHCFHDAFVQLANQGLFVEDDTHSLARTGVCAELILASAVLALLLVAVLPLASHAPWLQNHISVAVDHNAVGRFLYQSRYDSI